MSVMPGRMYALPAPAYGHVPLSAAPDVSRSPRLLLLFAFPVLISAAAYLVDGLLMLTDLAFVLLTALCIGCLIGEVLHFRRRVGIGGFVLYGGALVWFCHDYWWNWMGIGLSGTQAIMVASNQTVPVNILAKSAFFHALFMLMATAGLLIPWGQWLERLIARMPEPPSSAAYVTTVLVMSAIGLSTFVLFGTANLTTMLSNLIVAGRSSTDVGFTVGRTGNANYAWGGYIIHLFQTGQMSGILAGAFAIMVARTPAGRAFGWGMWLFWTAVTFGSGTRGEVVYMAMPVVLIYVLKVTTTPGSEYDPFRRLKLVVPILLCVGGVAVVQFQGAFRNVGFAGRSLSDVEFLAARGNHMFSEGLYGMYLIPNEEPAYYDTYPGEVWLRPIPDLVIRGVLHPIPRALWNDKPIDPIFTWYNAAYFGRRGGSVEGTTIAPGIVGDAYLRYGAPGVIQFALVFGWLAGVFERVLRNAHGRLLLILAALGLETWLFRCFRAINYFDLVPLAIGLFVLAVFARLLNAFGGRPRSEGPVVFAQRL